MKRGVSWCALAAIVAAVAATPAAAQPASDEWQVLVAPYLMGAALSGATTVRGVTVDIDVSPSDIFANLQFGAMALVAARKGNWGFGADTIWIALGTTVRETNVDFNQGAFAFYGLRRLGPAADVTFGLRVNTLRGKFTFKGPDVTRSQHKMWVDPLVGVTVRTPADRRVQLSIYAEVGGFGAGSDLAWQVFPTASLRLSEKVSFELGYRWLDLDYATGDGNEQFGYDVLAQGPAAGFAFRF